MNIQDEITRLNKLIEIIYKNSYKDPMAAHQFICELQGKISNLIVMNKLQRLQQLKPYRWSH